MGKLVTLKRMVLSCLVFALALNVQAQVNAYSWSQSSGTFTPLSGGTVYGTTASDDQRYVTTATPAGGTTTTGIGLPIGFNFVFNADTFDRIGINTNGWISFGKSSLTPSVNMASSNAYYPLPSTSTITPTLLRNRFAGLGRDLQARAGSSITLAVTGTTPNQVCVVEWLNYKRYNSGTATDGDTINFQIRLYETTNIVEVVYGKVVFDVTTAHTGASNSPQVGLGGKTSADFNSRTTTTNWNSSTAAATNTAGLDVTSGVVYPTNGLTMQWTPPVPCAGAPVAGTAAASAGSVCPGTVVNLSVTGSSSGVTGLTYQWIRSTDGTNYSNLPNGTGLTASDTVSQVKYFRLIVTCTASGLSDTSIVAQVNLNAPTACYCTPTYSNGCGTTGGDAITSVVLNNLTNNTGCAATPYYTFYNSVTVPDIQQTTTDSVYISFGSDGSQFAGVWIDFNQDGDFSDAGEFVAYNTTTAGASGTVGLAFNIPLTATLGQTRMRIRGGNDSQLANTPCGASSSSWGETEDYLVNITAAPPCVPATMLAVPSVTDSTATITWSSIVGNTSSLEYGPTGFTPGTGTTLYNVVSPLTITGLLPQTTYQFYVTDTCSGPVTAGTSGPASFTTLCSPFPYPGDTYNGAISITSYPYSATTSTADPCITDASALRTGMDLFYKFVADSCATEITFSLCGSGFDTYLYILDSAGVNVLESSDDDCGTASEITFTPTPGTTYVAVVEPYSSSGVTGTVIVNVTQVTGSPVVSSTYTSPSCQGVADGTASVSVDDFGILPISYSWSTGGTGATISNITSGTYYVTVTTGCGSVIDTVVVPPTFNATVATVTNVSCNGGNNGAVDVDVVNGATPYTFAWSNSAATEDLTGLTAGTYNLTVTENGGCSVTLSATVTEPAALVVTETVSPALCNGGSSGSISVVVTGGTAGAVSQTITATGGSLTQTSTFTFTNIPAVSVPGNLVFSAYGDLDGNAAQSNLENWVFYDENGNQLATVGGTGNSSDQCGPTLTTTIVATGSQMAAWTADGTVTFTAVANANVNLTLCGGDFVSTQFSFQGAYNYAWSNSATTSTVSGLAAGNYSVTVTDALGCTATETYTVTEPLPLLPALDSLFNVSCNGLSDGGIYVTITGGTPNYTYQWSNGSTSEDLMNIPAGVYTGTVTDANGCTFVSPQIPVTEPAALVASVTAYEDISCNGAGDGSIDVSVTGGTSPYGYNWSATATTEDLTGLQAATYDLTVTDDNGCTATVSQAIAEPAVLMLMWDSTVNSLCNGDSHGGIYVTPMGGTTPYTFVWNNNSSDEDLTQVPAGEYTVNMTDANGCTVTAVTDTVTQPEALAAVVDAVTGVSCNGLSDGAVSVTVTGGTGSPTYSWSNGSTDEDLTGLGDGIYNLTATDGNGCTATTTAVIAQPDLLVVTSDSAKNVKCFGGTNGGVFITVSGGTTPYDYDWSNSSTNEDLTAVGAGSYTATVTDANGCTVATTAATVTAPSAALTATSTSTDEIQGGVQGSVNVTTTGGTTPYTFSWSNNATTEDLSAVAAGNYTLTITDANGCTTTLTDTVKLIIGIEELAGGYTLNMYPNPTSGVVTFDVTLPATDNVTIEVYNVAGQAIRRITERDVMQTKMNVNLADEAEGVYLARIIVGSQVITKHVVVNK